jgi:hypothetical protein
MPDDHYGVDPESVGEAAEILGIQELLRRKPRQLSGGQRHEPIRRPPDPERLHFFAVQTE